MSGSDGSCRLCAVLLSPHAVISRELSGGVVAVLCCWPCNVAVADSGGTLFHAIGGDEQSNT